MTPSIFSRDSSNAFNPISLISCGLNKSSKNKQYLLKCTHSSGYRSQLIIHEEILKCNGIIFLFSKYGYDSLKYLLDFSSRYHKVIGKKFVPSSFVQLENCNKKMNYTSTLTREEVEMLTMNNIFPLVKIKNNFDKSECEKIINSIFSEIKKEKNDEIPYSLVYQESLKINCCLKNGSSAALIKGAGLESANMSEECIIFLSTSCAWFKATTDSAFTFW
jgi:hypothetical protein